MHPAYFDTRFRIDAMPEQWPAQFVILSAWATTGQSWTQQANEAADRQLAHQLAERGLWNLRITGYSPVTGHAEPSWAFPMALSEACDLGQQFRQDALYYVEADQLSVTHCDHRRSLVPVGSFRQRLDAK
jgi:hypothetical protein